MPKEFIDYSNTIIYKICCNDTNITDIYVGHTTNFIKRKYQHKVLCNSSSKLKIYDTIRKNGGWDNWNMIEIAKYSCQDATEARIREQEHYEQLKPSLNSVNPITNNIYSTLAIDNTIQTDNNIPTNKDTLHKFHCYLCDYYTNRRCNYNDHLLSKKHQNSINVNKNQQICGQNQQKIIETEENTSTKFICKICNKIYKDNSGLWRHKKKCKQIIQDDEDDDKDTNNSINGMSDKDIILMLIQQNKDLMEVVKNGTNNTSNSHNHSHNKTFNLQFFLNETCKDAMNISEFVSSIKPQLDDLEATGRLGYVEGITNIILNSLKSINTPLRPLHCSDQKREVIYIKDNDEWIKEEEDKPILTKAIKVIANENIKNINEWKKTYPDCTKSDSKKNDLYLKIVSNSMNGLTKDEADKNINKIISNVAKKVVIDKTGSNV